MIVVAIWAVILATLPVITAHAPPGMGKRVRNENCHGECQQTIFIAVDPEEKWRTIAFLVDISLIGLAVWLVRRDNK